MASLALVTGVRPYHIPITITSSTGSALFIVKFIDSYGKSRVLSMQQMVGLTVLRVCYW